MGTGRSPITRSLRVSATPTFYAVLLARVFSILTMIGGGTFWVSTDIFWKTFRCITPRLRTRKRRCFIVIAATGILWTPRELRAGILGSREWDGGLRWEITTTTGGRIFW